MSYRAAAGRMFNGMMIEPGDLIEAACDTFGYDVPFPTPRPPWPRHIPIPAETLVVIMRFIHDDDTPSAPGVLELLLPDGSLTYVTLNLHNMFRLVCKGHIAT